ncbi:MAG: hypothetical protein PHH06_05025 [Candidatus Gracilibacteria bacterium]|nr:hypothetical protein [Candidatus Gracilibacteria bacterium]
MKEALKVKKWGGENAAELTQSPQNVLADFRKGVEQVLVVSAIRSPKFNTTDKLIIIGKLLGDTKITFQEVESKIEELKEFHLDIIKEKLENVSQDLLDYVAQQFDLFKAHIEFWCVNKQIIPNKENDYLINTQNGSISIIGFGEYISACILSIVINALGEDGISSSQLDLSNITDGIDGNSEQLFRELSERISKRVNSLLEFGVIPVVPGYIPGFEQGIENAIGRGYSDATASMVAVGLSEDFDVTLEVQKSVRGMLSADPRLLENSNTAKLIERLDYLTAKEITGIRGAQAKLLHNQVLRRELQESGIKVYLFDPFREGKGTIISKQKNLDSSGVEFIGGRDKVLVCTVSLGNMSDSGIVFKIFSIVQDYASVDIIGTSETELSFTIDAGLSKNKLAEMSDRIRKSLGIQEDGYENFVRFQENKSLVYCVGQNLSHSLGSLGRAATALASGGVNIEMVSQGTMERAMVFCIRGEDFKKAVNLLHDEFIR